MEKNIADLRLDYKLQSLDIEDISPNPFEQFANWFDAALQSDLREPNAMIVATVGEDNMPNARVVLLKGFDEKGFVFYTNYGSAKGKELAKSPKIAAVFNWLELERQVRIQGHVKKADETIATQYFQSRPKSSQIGAWASPQSQVVENRSVLEQSQQDFEQQYQDKNVLPKPPHWGGYVIEPISIEFWQGRRSRLHDRLRYTKQSDGNWLIERLAP